MIRFVCFVVAVDDDPVEEVLDLDITKCAYFSNRIEQVRTTYKINPRYSVAKLDRKDHELTNTRMTGEN